MDFATELTQFYTLRKASMLKDSKQVFDIDKLCFPEQVAFIRSTARYKLARCTRRSGKTTALAHYLVDECLKHRRIKCVYISKTRDSAKDIVWQILKDIVEDNDIKVKTNETDLTMKFHKTESSLKIFGADKIKDMEKRRGLKLRLAIIDECQLFDSSVKILIDDILSIALTDQQGTLCISGTPSPACGGVFYDKDHSEGYEKHFWSWRNNKFYIDSAMEFNPNLSCPDDIMLQDLKQKGQLVTDPSVRREWFGEWVRSENLLVYKYKISKQDYDVVPQFPFYVLGIDIGSNDADAITCWGWSYDIEEAYVVEQFKKSKQNITDLGVMIQYFIDKYNPQKMVMDAGALGLKIQEELNFRNPGWRLEAADKKRKWEYITLFNNALEQGLIKIKKGSELAAEMRILTKNEEKFNQGILEEDGRYANDLCDSALYGWKEMFNFRFKAKVPTKTPQEILDEKIRAEKERALTRKVRNSDADTSFLDPDRVKNFTY